MLPQTIKKGFLNGLKCCWFLIKIIVPVFFVITVLKHTPVMDWLAGLFAPAMALFRLPGEAALPIITAFFLDEYGVIAAMKAVELSGYAVAVVAVMTLVAHSLIVEAAIVRKLEMSAMFFTTYRLLAAVVVGLVYSGIGVVFQLW